MPVLAAANTMLATAKAAMYKCVHRDKSRLKCASSSPQVCAAFKMKEVEPLNTNYKARWSWNDSAKSAWGPLQKVTVLS